MWPCVPGIVSKDEEKLSHPACPALPKTGLGTGPASWSCELCSCTGHAWFNGLLSLVLKFLIIYEQRTLCSYLHWAVQIVCLVLQAGQFVAFRLNPEAQLHLCPNSSWDGVILSSYVLALQMWAGGRDRVGKCPATGEAGQVWGGPLLRELLLKAESEARGHLGSLREKPWVFTGPVLCIFRDRLSKYDLLAITVGSVPRGTLIVFTSWPSRGWSCSPSDHTRGQLPPFYAAFS